MGFDYTTEATIVLPKTPNSWPMVNPLTPTVAIWVQL